MAKLISLDEVKTRQRIDTDARDADIDLAIESASRAILGYITSSDPDWVDSDGEPEDDSDGIALNVPDDVKQACHVLTGMILRDPSGKDSAWVDGFLPAPVTCWLTRYILPTLA